MPSVGFTSLSFLSLRILAQVIFSPQSCETAKSYAQLPAFYGWWKSQCLMGKQLRISDSLLCISLLSRILAFKSWPHWELSSVLSQIVLFCFIHLFYLLLVRYKLSHHCRGETRISSLNILILSLQHTAVSLTSFWSFVFNSIPLSGINSNYEEYSVSFHLQLFKDPP